MDLINKERYSRHILLRNFGMAAQEKLQAAKVLVVGAGGLGCPALQYLAAAGVGQIGIVDDDVVSLSNLQRQVLYSLSDVGFAKAEKAAARLRALNEEVKYDVHAVRLDTSNALKLLSGYDIIVDGTDNFASRYLINDACVLLNKPLVFAAIFQYEGQLAVFNVEDAAGRKSNYRDLFSSPPGTGDAPDCNVAGVLGVLPGIIGTMQAAEVIKLITGIGKPLINQLLTYNLLTHEFYKIEIPAAEKSHESIPKNAEAFKRMDYGWFCAGHTAVKAIDADEWQQFMADADTIAIDVREKGEEPAADFMHLQIPLSALEKSSVDIRENTILVFCQSGKRSMKAAEMLTAKYGKEKNIFSLSGGIVSLNKNT